MWHSRYSTRTGSILAITAFLMVTISVIPRATAQPVSAREDSLQLPTYPWWPPLLHPTFREIDGRNIYPYPMQDNLSRDQTVRTYRTVILENEYLRITFLPELGGKIHEVIDKTQQQPMFYVNHVVKPGLIAMCGAWTSGGVEWNTGPQGHTVSAMQPVSVRILPSDPDGSQSVAIGETERIYGTKWTVVVTLRPGRSFIEERIRIYNPTLSVRPYYFWNCTAAANTPGFRFIYPMTLGCDHGAEKFFQWPVDHGKDLTRGTNYQDASSIFAWYCDQDFFGSYDDQSDRGVVAYANHFQVPGKKAWTWGQGGFGQMHQRDLTDSDGPYNEVQTGPLLTQGEVGRLDPCEAVEWQEWWYPIHGTGAFTHANRNVAATAALKDGHLGLKLIGTGEWSPVKITVRSAENIVAESETRLSPAHPVNVNLQIPKELSSVKVLLDSNGKALAEFAVPLPLPVRTPPGPKALPTSASELAQAGWDHYLFARLEDAENSFRKSLEKDPKSGSAYTGLAFTYLYRNPNSAYSVATNAMAVDPDAGLPRLLASALSPEDDSTESIDIAWKAALDPKTAIAGRALAAKHLLRLNRLQEVTGTLSLPGPVNSDPVCLNLAALAQLRAGNIGKSIELARRTLSIDPIDSIALCVLWLTKTGPESNAFEKLLLGNTPMTLEVISRLAETKYYEEALQVLERLYVGTSPAEKRDPLLVYWANWLQHMAARQPQPRPLPSRSYPHPEDLFPHGIENRSVLEYTLTVNPQDGLATLLRGHLLFDLGDYSNARAQWQKAADLGTAPGVAYRALGMAASAIDRDLKRAVEFLKRGHELDPADAILARDLAKVLLSQAEKTEDTEQKTSLIEDARDALRDAYTAGKSRSDFVCLLARAYNHLGEYEDSANLLDRVRITVWEGSHEAHDLFETAHLALGREQLQEGHPELALAEFNRALEYPANLAIGRLENARESHIHQLRAQAFSALGRVSEAEEASQKAK